MTIKTAGDLRKFLTETLDLIRTGDVDEKQANSIAKIAGQINASLSAEVQIALVSDRIGKEFRPGLLVIGEPETVAVIEHQANVTQISTKPKAPDLELSPPTDRMFCEQCERSVKKSEAESCVSAFCKAQALVA